MLTRVAALAGLAALTLGCSPAAQSTAESTGAPAQPVLQIEAPVVTPTPGGRNVSAGYLRIVNSGGAPDRLVAVTSPAAGRVDIHETRQGAGGVVQMFPIASVPIPADGAVTFAPGGLHLMLMDLHAPLAEGARVRLSFDFERADTIELEAQVARHGSAAHGH